MSDSPATATHDDWHPAPHGLALSGYGEWPDEGTDSLIADVAARAAELVADRVTVPVPKFDCEVDTGLDAAQQMYGAWLGREQIWDVTYLFAGNRSSSRRFLSTGRVRADLGQDVPAVGRGLPQATTRDPTVPTGHRRRNSGMR